MGAVQAAGIGLLTAVLLLILRELRPVMALPVRLAAMLLLLGSGIGLMHPVLERVRALLEAAEAGGYTELILRAVGIGLLAELGASFCRELGEHALADGVLFFGRAEILVLSLPLLDRLVDLAEEMLKW